VEDLDHSTGTKLQILNFRGFFFFFFFVRLKILIRLKCFSITQKTLFSKKWIYIYISINHFLSLSFSFSVLAHTLFQNSFFAGVEIHRPTWKLLDK
jgi:hypothetical protein